MKILVATYGFPAEGDIYNGVFVLRQVQALQALGHDIRVVRFIPPVLPWGNRRALAALPSNYQIDGADVRVARIPSLPRLTGLPISRAAASLHFRSQCAAFSPDVIHAHALFPAGYLSFGRSAPTILTAHGTDAYGTPYRRPDLMRAARRIVRESDALVGVSSFIREHLVSMGGADARVIFNGADAAVFSNRDRVADRTALAIEEKRLVIAFVGSLQLAKGVDELTAALCEIHDLNPLVLIGGVGGKQDEMTRILRENKVETRFLGAVPHTTVAQLFGAADIVALPSHAEGLPAVICEAMLAGRAVAATPVGGIPEIIHDGVTGSIVPKKDARALARAFRHLARNPLTRELYGRQAAAFASKHLTWDANARAYTALYEETTAARGRR